MAQRIIIVFLLYIFSVNMQAQNIYIPVKYNIHAVYNEENKTIEAFENITITNNSTDTLDYIWLHAKANAFNNDQTTYNDFSLKSGSADFYFSDDEERSKMGGYDFKVNSKPVEYLINQTFGEVIKIRLKEKLFPAEKIEITTPFTLKLPAMFDSLGFKKDTIFLSRWYLSVPEYKKDIGWNLIPFIGDRYDVQQKNEYNITFNVNNTEKKINLSNVSDAELILTKNKFLISSPSSFSHTTPWIKEGIEEDETFSKSVFHKRGKHLFSNKMPEDKKAFLLQNYEQVGKGQSIISGKERTAYQRYLFENIKSELWFDSLESFIGFENYNNIIEQIRKEIKIVDERELEDILNKKTNKNLSAFMGLLYSTNTLYTKENKKLKPTVFFNLQETNKYNYIGMFPVVGYNNYDKVMMGLFLHNYQLPLTKFNFYMAPLHATNTRKLNGIAGVAYNIFKPKYWLRFSLDAAQHSYEEITLPALSPLYYKMNKIVPSVKMTLYNDDVTSKREWSFGLKNYLIQFDKYNITFNNDIYSATPQKTNANIVEAYASLSDTRVLYPYDLSLITNTGKDFMRLSMQGNYYFNYDATHRGAIVRAFVGKFFYTSAETFQKQFETSPYHFRLSATSVSDFTYSHYFIGRSEQQGWMSNQIVKRDGFFKVGMPMSSNPVGTSDNWIAALNFTIDIPKKYDPFKRLPFNNFIKLFIDVGSFAEAWSDNTTTGKFVYDAGLQFSMCKEAINIYFPLFYSKVYRDYYKSIYRNNYFVKTISFSLSLEKIKKLPFKTIVPL